MRDNYQFEAISQWSLFRHGNASNSSTILSITSPLGIWSSYYQVLHLGRAVAYWLLCPHPLGKNVNYFFFRSGPDGLKPTPCCFFGIHRDAPPAESQQNPLVGVFGHATTCHLCWLPGEPWGCLLSRFLPQLVDRWPSFPWGSAWISQFCREIYTQQAPKTWKESASMSI